MNALTLRDLEAADRLALARLDDDGAPAAVTSVVSHGSAKTAHILAGAAAGAAAATSAGLPSPRVSMARSTEDGGHTPATHIPRYLALSLHWTPGPA